MKVKNISNPKLFFERLQHCKGNIEVVTPEGDRLNMKSKLCQYIVMMNIFNNAEIAGVEHIIVEAEAYESADMMEGVAKCADYLLKADFVKASYTK